MHENGAACRIAALEDLKDPAIGRVYLMIGHVTFRSWTAAARLPAPS